jgi:hypothetical protein
MRFQNILVCLGLGAFCVSQTLPAYGGVELKLVARTGVKYTRLKGKLTGFGQPVVNNENEAAFVGTLLGFDTVVTGDRASTLGIVAQSGKAAPGVTDGLFDDFPRGLILNDAGQVLVRGRLEIAGAITASNHTGLWVGVPGALSLVVRAGDAAPGLSGNTFLVSMLDNAAFNDAGTVAFINRVLPDSITPDSVWAGDPTGILNYALRGNTAFGPGNKTYLNFSRVFLGRSTAGTGLGSLTFAGVDSTANFNCIFHTDLGTGTGTRLLAAASVGGDPAETGTAGDIFDSFQQLQLSVADSPLDFGLPATSRATDNALKFALFQGPDELLRKGATGPGGVVFKSFGQGLPGQTLFAKNGITFIATLEVGQAGVTGNDDTGIYLVKTNGDIVQLAREGSAAPGTTDGAVFDDFIASDTIFVRGQGPVVNRFGGYAFRARLRGTGLTDENKSALYVGEPGELPALLLRTGFRSVVPGVGRVTPSLLEITDGAGTDGPSNGADGRGRAFNDLGMLAFHAGFTNGAQAILLGHDDKPARPDAILVPLTPPFPPIGDNVYGGKTQFITSKPMPATTVTYRIVAENDSAASDRLIVKGTGSKKPFTVTYRDEDTHEDITADVVAGRWNTGPLGAGANRTIVVKVDVASTAKRQNFRRLAFTVRSASSPRVRDTVRAAVDVETN